MRQTWKGINELLGGMKKKWKTKNINFIGSNSENAALTGDPKAIGNTLNEYFATVGDKLASAIPEVSGTFSNYLDPRLSNTFYFDPIIPQEVENMVEKHWELCRMINHMVNDHVTLRLAELVTTLDDSYDVNCRAH